MHVGQSYVEQSRAAPHDGQSVVDVRPRRRIATSIASLSACRSEAVTGRRERFDGRCCYPQPTVPTTFAHRRQPFKCGGPPPARKPRSLDPPTATGWRIFP